MLLYQSDAFSIDYREKEQLILPRWSGAEMNAETFMEEMKNYMLQLEKTDTKNVIWDHTHFHFQIPAPLYNWIENNINLPAKAMGMEKISFILGEDVMAQFSTMDCFEATQSVYAPRYFSDPAKAFNWINKKEKANANPFDKEISFLVEKNLEAGTARIQIEITLEQLPYYLKKVKDLFNHQAFVHKNYQKYMLLTSREKEILAFITQGYSNKAIAENLFASVHTVITHRRNIMKKLECKNIAALIQYKLFL